MSIDMVPEITQFFNDIIFFIYNMDSGILFRRELILIYVLYLFDLYIFLYT